MIAHIRKLSEDDLNKILSLRKRGWTYKSLAYIYGVDHSSIYHQCKKNKAAKPEKEISFDLPSVIEISDPDNSIFGILKVVIRPKPMSYFDYLKMNLK